MWNAWDYVLQFNFKIAHISSSVNTAADFVSRLELKATEKLCFKIHEFIQTTTFELTASSSDVTDEEQFLLRQADNKNESKKQSFQRKEQSPKDAKQWLANEEPPWLRNSVKEISKIDGNPTINSMNGIKSNARLRLVEDVFLVLQPYEWKD